MHPLQVALPGVLGGLGPLAHIEFERRLLLHSVRRGARCDQDHPDWIVISACSTPDRTQSLAGEASSSLPSITHAALALAQTGADFLIVTCNVAHAYRDAIQPLLPIPWLDLQRLTGEAISAEYAGARVGIMEADGAGRHRLYFNRLVELGIEPVSIFESNPALQAVVMNAIYNTEWGIKSTGVWVSDRALDDVRTAMGWLHDQGADVVIAGCTELSIAFDRMRDRPLPFVDPLDVAAEVTLDLAFGVRPLRAADSATSRVRT